MKAKIEQVNRYNITIGDETFSDFRKTGEWEGMLKFEHPTMGGLIVNAPGSFDDLFAKIFCGEPSGDIVELNILKASPKLTDKIPSESAIE